MSQTIEEKNKALVLEAFDTLFNKRGVWARPLLRRIGPLQPRVSRLYQGPTVGG
jgi:hypothetical protein